MHVYWQNKLVLAKYAEFMRRFEARRVLLEANKETVLPHKNREKKTRIWRVLFFFLFLV